MKINFHKSQQQNWQQQTNDVSLSLAEYLGSGKDFVVELKHEKTPKQLRGYWRLCGLVEPHMRQEFGTCFDKELVSEFVKQRCNYSVRLKNTTMGKSLKNISIQEINILIEKLYEICEFFGVKDYELRPQEIADMNDYYKKD